MSGPYAIYRPESALYLMSFSAMRGRDPYSWAEWSTSDRAIHLPRAIADVVAQAVRGCASTALGVIKVVPVNAEGKIVRTISEKPAPDGLPMAWQSVHCRCGQMLPPPMGRSTPPVHCRCGVVVTVDPVAELTARVDALTDAVLKRSTKE